MTKISSKLFKCKKMTLKTSKMTNIPRTDKVNSYLKYN